MIFLYPFLVMMALSAFQVERRTGPSLGYRFGVFFLAVRCSWRTLIVVKDIARQIFVKFPMLSDSIADEQKIEDANSFGFMVTMGFGLRIRTTISLHRSVR